MMVRRKRVLTGSLSSRLWMRWPGTIGRAAPRRAGLLGGWSCGSGGGRPGPLSLTGGGGLLPRRQGASPHRARRIERQDRSHQDLCDGTGSQHAVARPRVDWWLPKGAQCAPAATSSAASRHYASARDRTRRSLTHANRVPVQAAPDARISSGAQVTAMSANTPASALRKQKRDARGIACGRPAACPAIRSAISFEPARCRSAANALPLPASWRAASSTRSRRARSARPRRRRRRVRVIGDGAWG